MTPAGVTALVLVASAMAAPARFNAKYAYEDRRQDYVTSEPTIDSAAATILLLAALQGAG